MLTLKSGATASVTHCYVHALINFYQSSTTQKPDLPLTLTRFLPELASDRSLPVRNTWLRVNRAMNASMPLSIPGDKHQKLVENHMKPAEFGVSCTAWYF
jgi:hypothetical protein